MLTARMAQADADNLNRAVSLSERRRIRVGTVSPPAHGPTRRQALLLPIRIVMGAATVYGAHAAPVEGFVTRSPRGSSV
ncbi:hypothetical protein AB0950_09060 [Streptomyces sp. NPDC007189]|uniref:hypothetical protein n=1 Tax=Streptomyces sp. NPDC007189 TaxID=3154315 RepID=UPI003452D9C3